MNIKIIKFLLKQNCFNINLDIISFVCFKKIHVKLKFVI